MVAELNKKESDAKSGRCAIVHLIERDNCGGNAPERYVLILSRNAGGIEILFTNPAKKKQLTTRM